MLFYIPKFFEIRTKATSATTVDCYKFVSGG